MPNDDPNQFLMGTGAASFKFTAHGDTIDGEIVSLDLQAQRDINTGVPLTWDDGNPRMQLRIVMATDARDPERTDDTGERAIYVRGQMQAVVREAIRAAGAERIESGGRLAVVYTGDGEPPRRGMNAPKLYKAKYAPPAAMAVSADDLF